MVSADGHLKRLAHHGKPCWNSIILGCIERGEFQHALDLYGDMRTHSAFVNIAASVALLKACGMLKVTDRGQQIHTDIVQLGLEGNVFVGNSLVGMFGKCGFLSDAQEVFDKLPEKNVVSWNALITGYTQHGLGEEVMNCFEKMQLDGVSPNAVTFMCSLKCCSRIGAVERGWHLHTLIIEEGLEKETQVGNTLVDMFSKFGLLAEAQEVFNNLLLPDAVSWNTLISGYVEHGLGSKALSYFEKMQHHRFTPDVVTFTSCLRACGSIIGIDKGQQIYDTIIKGGLEKNIVLGSALIDMFAKCGFIVEAQYIFDKLPGRDIVVWNALITAYSEHGLGGKALTYFELMEQNGVFANTVTFIRVLKACSSIGCLQTGREIRAKIAKKGFEQDLYVGSSLVDMFAKCGSLKEAQEVFDKLPTKTAVSWSALISGYVEHGLAEEALNGFQQMRQEGITPAGITFAHCLKACVILGDIETGQKIRAAVSTEGLETDLYVGSCLVDMFGKFGLLAEAREVFDKLEVRNVVSWNALIAGYAEHELGEEALTCFEQMQVDSVAPDAVTFVCSLKVCCSLGAVDKGRELHNQTITIGLDKDPYMGSTLIDMYSECCSLVEAQKVFSKMTERNVVVWSAMIKGYGINNQGNMAVRCFREMQNQGVEPDDVVFMCLLVACSHCSMVIKGQEYFELMRREHGIEPSTEHHACMVDIFARSGYVYEAQRFIETMKFPPSKEMWNTLLTACKNHGEVFIGMQCFQYLFMVNPEDAPAYAMMSELYATAARWDDVLGTERLRKRIGAAKKRASASLEVNNKVNLFVVGEYQREETLEMAGSLGLHLKDAGYIPILDLISRLDLIDINIQRVINAYF